MTETNQNRQIHEGQNGQNLEGIRLFLNTVNKTLQDVASGKIVMFGHGRLLQTPREEEAARQVREETERTDSQT
ncbi:MAG: hypothetical protein ACD_12C00034G0008 [uncultured bacterium]|nr:MAG: hypothetical protein ACD_12C00034G0008 [uncultured bacterium]